MDNQKMMRAMVITGFGGPEVFQERMVPKPEPGPHEVLVKVYAASINPVDYKIRMAGQWANIKPPAIIGYDAAGVVEAKGACVQDFEIGDKVYYTPEIGIGQGSYAEYEAVNAAIVARMPANLDFVQAASIPLAGGTAWDALMTWAKICDIQSVLIHGGSGGVGSLAVQIAKAAGAHVFATCSSRNLDFVKSLGADYAIDYQHDDFVAVVCGATNDEGVDVVFDTVGGDILARSIDVAKPFGKLVGIANTTGNLNTAYRKNLTIYFEFLQRARYKLDDLRILIERNKIKPVIDTVLPLSEVAKAQQMLEHGGVRGKIVLKVA